MREVREKLAGNAGIVHAGKRPSAAASLFFWGEQSVCYGRLAGWPLEPFLDVVPGVAEGDGVSEVSVRHNGGEGSICLSGWGYFRSGTEPGQASSLASSLFSAPHNQNQCPLVGHWCSTPATGRGAISRETSGVRSEDPRC